MIRIMTEKAYAKINLYLEVRGKRPDGYHDLESIMQQVSLFDYITVVRSVSDDTSGIAVLCTDKSIPEDKRNIVYKCADAFFSHFGITEYNITIHIDKRIPSAAGLAGGSTDGAAVLKILNTMFDVNAGLSELCDIGKKIGADIPICLIGGTCVCKGIGEILIPQKITTPANQILIVFPGNGVSTAAAYKMLDESEDDSDGYSADNIITALKNGKIPTRLYNSFERVILPVHPAASNVREIMHRHGAEAMMSGSGPSVFGLFGDCDAIKKAQIELLGIGFRSHICSPVLQK